MIFSTCPKCQEYKLLTKSGTCHSCVDDSIVLRRRIPTDATNSLLRAILSVCDEHPTVEWDSNVRNVNADGELRILTDIVVLTGTGINTELKEYKGTEEEKYKKAIDYCVDKAIDRYT